MSFVTEGKFLAEHTDDFVLKGLACPNFLRCAREALTDTDRWNKRNRKLNPVLIIGLLVMMVLHRALSIANVFNRLRDTGAVWCRSWLLPDVSPEALLLARARLGMEPLKLLFEKLSECQEAARARFLGFRAYGIDGCQFTTPDSPKNDAAFGRAGTGRGKAAYPQILGVFLVDLASRVLARAWYGPRAASEREPVSELIAELGSDALIMFDRGIASYRIFRQLAERGVHFLGRLSSSWRPRIVKQISPGDYIVQLEPCDVERKKLKKDGLAPQPLLARMLCYRIGLRQEVRLLTDLLDSKAYPARELAKGYHQRWECELTYKELKVQLTSVTHGKQATTFRSKSPEGVLQEAWAMAIAYNLVRLAMQQAADQCDLCPLALSFVDSLEVVRRWIPRMRQATPDQQDQLRLAMLDQIGNCRVRSRRPRWYPRVVKRKMSNYKLKRAGHGQQWIDVDKELILTGIGA